MMLPSLKIRFPVPIIRLQRVAADIKTSALRPHQVSGSRKSAKQTKMRTPTPVRSRSLPNNEKVDKYVLYF